ncbi:MAG: tetraacyldisaccharide 4'-kinase, partial [Burkholderiaceae bacterium]
MKATAPPYQALRSPEACLQQAWQSRGVLARSLWPLAALFGGLVAARRLAYRQAWLPQQELAVPVIVVGNLIAGGAGKTPATIAIVALLRRHGWVPGIISRGYGGRGGATPLEVRVDTPATACGDEPLLMRRRTGLPVVVGRNRVAAGRALLRNHPEIDVIVSDDGLQHLRLARDAQVLVFDERGAGNGWMLPAGPLREPIPAAVPARSVVLYNAPEATTALPGHCVQ